MRHGGEARAWCFGPPEAAFAGVASPTAPDAPGSRDHRHTPSPPATARVAPARGRHASARARGCEAWRSAVADAAGARRAPAGVPRDSRAGSWWIRSWPSPSTVARIGREGCHAAGAVSPSSVGGAGRERAAERQRRGETHRLRGEIRRRVRGGFRVRTRGHGSAGSRQGDGRGRLEGRVGVRRVGGEERAARLAEHLGETLARAEVCWRREAKGGRGDESETQTVERADDAINSQNFAVASFSRVRASATRHNRDTLSITLRS